MSVSLDRKLFVKSVVIGVFAAVASIAAMLCIICVILLTAGSLPYEYLSYIMLAVDAVGVLLGSYLSARIAGKNGLIVGLSTAAIVLISLLIAGFSAANETLSFITLLRIIIVLIAGAAGGIKGVNRKQKIHIK